MKIEGHPFDAVFVKIPPGPKGPKDQSPPDIPALRKEIKELQKKSQNPESHDDKERG